ncbi:DNA cytosine methyltransferase [Aliterella atlantica]|uniref:DNA cytosine methyltransferase n=1 Tax=Aliterella atlantica TaxID=1827278 RepID=UPI0009081D6E
MLVQLDLCSGVGAGFPLASLITGGFELVGLCEWDEYCRDILAKRFKVEVLNDIKNCDWGSWQQEQNVGIDIITASPPCQPFSLQGKRKGAGDERNCFGAVLKALSILQPKFFAIENVPGLLTCPYFPGDPIGSYFSNLLWSLQSCGYDAQWLCVGSGHFGAPFIRERLLLVGVSQRLKLDWESATPWTEQVRSTVEETRGFREARGIKSPIYRENLQSAVGLDESPGIKSGNGIIRARRAALGNCLDPRVASIALRRVLYLNSLCK